MLRELISGFSTGNFEFTDIIIYIISALAVIFITLTIHEFAHAFIAVKLGDNTPRWQGRYTINPFAHIDYLGALAIILVGFGWARPVQVNNNNFRSPKWGMALVALAGPVSNVILSFIALLLCYACATVFEFTQLLFFDYAAIFLNYVAFISISLAVFNLIPIPPLDGSRILTAFLPYKAYYTLMRFERYSSLILLALIYIGILDKPIDLVTNFIYAALSFVTALPFELLFF